MTALFHEKIGNVAAMQWLIPQDFLNNEITLHSRQAKFIQLDFVCQWFDSMVFYCPENFLGDLSHSGGCQLCKKIRKKFSYTN